MTTREAAAELGLSINAIQQYTRRYGIGMYCDGRWELDDDDLDVIRKRMQSEKPVGRRAR